MRPQPLYAKDVAFVAGRPALIIANELEDLIHRRQRLNGGGTVPEDVAATLRAIRKAADAYVAEELEAAEVTAPEALVHSEGQSAVVPVLTAERVGQLLGLSDRRVRQLRTAGLLPARRVRGRWIWDHAVVQEFARERECR